MKKVLLLSLVAIFGLCTDAYGFGRRRQHFVQSNCTTCTTGQYTQTTTQTTTVVTESTTTESVTTQTVSQQVLSLVNQHRARLGLQMLSHSESMASYSTSWSSRIHSEGRLRHSSGFTSVGGSNEVVGQGQMSPDDIVRSWMNSPGHRSALMNPSARTLGAGNSGVFWTAVIGQ
jgi:uncharacterized protein YkwD